MNIKEHIEAGHYPKDEKGRALVPIARATDTFVVLATDAPGDLPIVGYRLSNGQVSPHRACTDFLLPPSPRKVTVTAWAQVARSGDIRGLARTLIGLPMHAPMNRPLPAGWETDLVIELTGEYEEPWS